MIRRNFIV